MAYYEPDLVVLACVFMVLPTIFVILRIMARRIRGAGLSWDDYTIFCGLILTLAACVDFMVATIDGRLGQHITYDSKGIPGVKDPRYINYEKSTFALEILAYSGLGCIKSSVVLLYMRIFDVPTMPTFHLIMRTVLVITVAWAIAFFFSTLFQCRTVAAGANGDQGATCVDIFKFYNAGSITDIIIDFSILALPIPIVLRLKLGPRQKYGVLAIFLLGILAAASSIARLVVYIILERQLTVHPIDQRYYIPPVYIVTVLEMDLAVISACLPTFRPLFNPARRRLFSKGSTGNQPTYRRQQFYDQPSSTEDGCLGMPELNPREISRDT